MPPIETMERNQKAMLWELSSVDNYGRQTVSNPIELDVRWEEDNRESVDQKGNTIAIQATVVVDREVAVHSIMWLGSSEEYFATVTPTGYMEVVDYREIVDLKGRYTRRTVDLIRYSNQLPEIA